MPTYVYEFQDGKHIEVFQDDDGWFRAVIDASYFCPNEGDAKGVKIQHCVIGFNKSTKKVFLEYRLLKPHPNDPPWPEDWPEGRIHIADDPVPEEYSS